MRKLKLIPKDEHVISDQDIACLLGKNDLKPCPFCGARAVSAGRLNKETGITVYKVFCDALHGCSAMTRYGDYDPIVARKKAVERWNNRTR